MLGFVIGAISLIGLMRLLRHRHGYGRWRGHGGCGHRRCGHHGHHRHHGRDDFDGRDFDGRGFDDGDDDGFGGGNRVVFLRSLFARLETTPGQERVIVDALKELKASFVKAKTQAKKSARDLGDAMQGDDLSVESMGSVFASLDEGAAAVRDGAFSALSKIHEVLDSRQRRVLADFITRSGGLEDLASSV